MSFKSIVDAWTDDLTDHIAELSDAKVHRYSSQPLEGFMAETGERHLSIAPTTDADVPRPFIAGSPPASEVTRSFAVLVWEDASAEGSRRFDDDVANANALALYEQIVGRLMVQANTSLGVANGYTQWVGGQTPRVEASVRWFAVGFTVRYPLSFT